MISWKRVFCKHRWVNYLYNFVESSPTKQNPETMTIAFSNCSKCAQWKLHFIYGNTNV